MKNETHKEKMKRKKMKRNERKKMDQNDNSEWFLYKASAGQDKKLNYIGLRPTKLLNSSNSLLKEQDFLTHRFMENGQLETENSQVMVAEKRNVVVEGIKKITGTDVTGCCVGFGDDLPSHFIVSFTHNGKLINLKGYVADLEVDHETTTLTPKETPMYNSTVH
jgi:hypothetical protein